MGLVSQAVPSLVGGVTQQAPSVRHPSQVTSMVNMVPSIASGLRKRIGTIHMHKLAGGFDYTNAFVHTIDRGDGERYFVVIDQGTLKVFTIEGVEKSVSFPNGLTYISNFVSGTLARDVYSATTIADYTFITNKNRVTAMMAHTPVSIPQELYVIVKTAVTDVQYRVVLNGVTYSYTFAYAANVTAKTGTIAAGLAAAINGVAGFTATVINGNQVKITHASLFTWSVSDDYGDQGLFAFQDKVNRYEELPRNFVTGRVVEVKGQANASSTSFHVEWVKPAGNTDGYWKETRPTNIDFAMDMSSMPHVLIRNSDGSFTFQAQEWGDRLVGDDDSNPVPAFIGQTINAIFFHRNRLGFLSDESVFMSQTGDYYNFWNASARASLDSDPIEAPSASTKVSFLRHVVPFDKSLLLFADQTQFQLSSGDTLTPKTVRLDPTTNFEAAADCPPVPLGKNVFFATNRGRYAAIREYYFDNNSVGNDADDTTAHVPSYVPYNVFKIVTAPTEDMVFVLTLEERNAIYVYNTRWNGNEKVQSAWHKWVLSADDTIIHATVFKSTMYLLIRRPNGTYIELIELEERPPGNTFYQICLDRRCPGLVGTYSSLTNQTTWTLPYVIPTGATVRVIQLNQNGSIGKGNVATYAAGYQVSLKGNHTAYSVEIGIEYEARVRLSELFYRAKEQSVSGVRLQLRDMVVQYDRTGFFEVEVTPLSRETYTYTMSGNKLGLAQLVIGTEEVESGSFKFPIMAKSDEVNIDLVNRTHLPCVFQTAEWQGHVMTQSRRQ
jgi:hypothetical protein